MSCLYDIISAACDWSILTLTCLISQFEVASLTFVGQPSEINHNTPTAHLTPVCMPDGYLVYFTAISFITVCVWCSGISREQVDIQPLGKGLFTVKAVSANYIH